MAALLVFIIFCQHEVLSRPAEPKANLLHSYASFNVRDGNFYWDRERAQPGSHVSRNLHPRQVPIERSNIEGGREKAMKRSKSLPSILFNQLDLNQQVLFLEKFTVTGTFKVKLVNARWLE